MAGRAHDVLSILESYRVGDLLDAGWRREARTPRVGAEAQIQGPGWGWSWMGAVLVDAGAAASGWTEGTASWGGVYGSWWAVDFERGITVVALTNTALTGMVGQFPRDLAAALARR